MLTLGIETSGQAGSVALVEGGNVLAETALSPSGRRHARTLVAELKVLLEQVDRRPTDCECVAVSIGPGSFTGLRVGVVCAKTFAYATGSRVVAVDTLEAIAAASPPDVERIDVVMDAMRGEVFYARFKQRDSRWSRSDDISIIAWEELSERLGDSALLSGPVLATISARDWAAPRLEESCWSPRASVVATIGEREALAGRTDDLWTLEPRYIRKSAAEEKAERTDPD